MMFFKTMTQSSGTRAGLSVALLALMSGMALAQDLGLGNDGTISILPADDVVLTDPPIVIGDEIVPVDEVIYEGEPEPCIGCELPPDEVPTDPGLPVDGVSPMPELPDPVGDGGNVGVGEPDEVTIYTQGEFPDSTCGGCEYETMAGPIPGGPEVQRTLSEADSRADDAGEAVKNNTNICYDADLYIPLLCDWQRPFVGDLMP